jgi:transcriptional regulator with XRE-family HTH domain
VTKTVGQVLREKRCRRGWTQREAAVQAKVSQPMWCEYETGKRLPSHAQTIDNIADALKMARATLSEMISKERSAVPE